MHENSKKKLIVAIKKLLKVTTLHNRNISFSETPSTPEEITKELNKRNVNFQFEIADIYWVFMESLYFIMYEVIGKDFGKKYIFNEIDDIEVTNLANKILEYFCDIPREYETQISLPQLILPNTPNDCELYLLSEVKKDLKKAMQFPPPSPAKICITSTGYYLPFKDAIFVKDALSKVNIFIFLLIQLKIIDHKPNNSLKVHEDLGVLSHEIPSVNLEIISKKYPTQFNNSNLNIASSKYFNEIKIAEDKYQSYIPEIVKLTNRILGDDTSEAKRIKSAIDWYIHSQSTTDFTMSFIQICIGLESVYGDDNDEGGLTNLLADRCSYLIGKTVSDRKFIKNRFKQIYRMRSKIIHGVGISFNDDSISIKQDATSYLKESINKEIYNMGWRIN